MKELNKIQQDTLEITAQKPIKKQQVLITRLMPHKGQHCYEFNLVTGKIEIAQFEQVDADFIAAAKGKKAVTKKLLAKSGCIYTTAINEINAQRKFMKMVAAQFK